MNISELERLIKENVEGQVVTLASEIFHGFRLYEFINEHFEPGKLEITGIGSIKIEDGAIPIVGKCFSRYYQVEPKEAIKVKAEFRISNNSPELNFSLELPPGWVFTDSFPGWLVRNPTEFLMDDDKTFLFDTLSFEQPILVLESNAESAEDDSLRTGINFRGELSLENSLKGVSYLLNNPSNLALKGLVTKDDDLFSMELESHVIPGVTIGLLTVSSQLKLLVENVYIGNSSYPNAFYSIEVRPGFNDYELLTSTQFSRSTTLLKFEGNFEHVGLSSLANLTPLVKTSEEGLEIYPSDFEIGNSLSLTYFSFSLLPGIEDPISLSATVEIDTSWEAIHGIKLENLFLAFTVDNPGLSENPKAYVVIGGIIDFGPKSQCIVSARFPGFALGIYLTEGHTISLNHFIEHLNLVDLALPGNFPGFDITYLAGQIDIKNQHLSFEGRLESDQSLVPGIKASESLGLSLFSQRSDPGALTSGSLDLDLTIKDPQSDKTISCYLYAALGAEMVFHGGIDSEGGLTIGEVFGMLAASFQLKSATLPSVLDQLQIEETFIQYNNKTHDFTFSLQVQFLLGGQSATVIVHVDLTHNHEEYTHQFSGVLLIGDLEFDLIFQQDNEESLFLAAYENNAGKEENLAALAALVTDDATVLNAASGLSFNLKDALLVVDKGGDGTTLFFGLDVGGGVDISKLPLVGKMFPGHTKVRVTLQPFLASTGFDQQDLEKVRSLVPGNGYQLPEHFSGNLGLGIQFRIGEEVIDMNLDVGAEDLKEDTGQKQAQTPGLTFEGPKDPIKWFQVQKQLGPVHLSRVGISYNSKQKEIGFAIDGAIAIAGLTISLDGLSASSTINPIKPHFDLHGLGIDYKNGPLEIGGAFLHRDGSYDGTALIKTSRFAIAALGSYSHDQKGNPSLFIYAYTNLVLGGPPFFFVTGLAAGFGFNRRIILPSVEEVRTFPLVDEVMSGPGNDSLSEELEKLHDFIPPSAGESFFAVGVRFSSFKLIDSFALLTVRFGKDFEVDVLGTSTLVIPTPGNNRGGEPLAEIDMNLRAVFNPGKGYLKIEAELQKTSYVLSRKCELTGGFAFYSWFKDGEGDAKAGDFVMVLGGYHPRFKKPGHYPRVAPVGFKWQVDTHLAVKGDFYCALVPSAVMAGGHLKATWEKGHVKAWFSLGADFIISWKPYFYDAQIKVEIGVRYTYHAFGTRHVSGHLGAGLHVWGPKFSGKAHIHLAFVTFDVRFGSRNNRAPRALQWSEFTDGFLPGKEKWISASVTAGLVKEIEADQDKKKVLVVNPNEITIETHSEIPVTKLDTNLELKDESKTFKKEFNVRPMHTLYQTFSCEYSLEMKNGNNESPKGTFDVYPIINHVPKALWGEYQLPNLFVKPGPEEEQLIGNVCTGFRIQAKPAEESQQYHPVDSKKLLVDNEPFGKSITFPSIRRDPTEWVRDRETIRNSLEIVTQQRDVLLGGLGFKKKYRPNKELVDDLVLTE